VVERHDGNCKTQSRTKVKLFTQVTMGWPERHSIDLAKIEVGQIPEYRTLVNAGKGPIPGEPEYFVSELEHNQTYGVFHFTIASPKGALVYCVGCAFETQSERAWEMAEKRFLTVIDLTPGIYQRMWSAPSAPWLASCLLHEGKRIDDNVDEWIREAENSLAWVLFDLTNNPSGIRS
jgi:hypothetical protein